VLVLDDQSKERAALVAQAKLTLSAVEVRDSMYRYYPHERLAAHVLGYMNQLRAEELDELGGQGYDASELIGRYGLERAWEPYLRGKKGIERYVANAKGERIDDPASADLIEGPRFEAPVAGHNVVLTIDYQLQKIVERAVRHHAAASVAVVEVDSGRILALASTPSFEPNTMTGRLSQAEFSLLMSDPRKPFVDKTLRQHYPPGSTYKFVSAVAALEDGLVDEHEKIRTPTWFRVGRRTFHGDTCDKRTNLIEALQTSCNTYFWKLAVDEKYKVGIDRMAVVARDFGFGAPTGLGLNGDVAGRVPTKLWYEERGPFKVGYTVNAAVGQGDVEVTVLQLAMAYAVIANGGSLYVPQIVRRVETASGQLVKDYEPQLRRRVRASSETLAAIRRGMWRVVNDPGGTAHQYGHSEVVEYAGKTGTAQVRNKRREPEHVKGWHPHRHHAWFAGFAPAVDPEIAVVVLIEHGGAGGKNAAPVARRVVEGYFKEVRKRELPGAEPAAKNTASKAAGEPQPPTPGLGWSGAESMYPQTAAKIREYRRRQKAKQEAAK
jgi:penicillin-binding protein 2